MPQSLHRKGDVGLEEPYTHPSDRRTLTDVEVAARLGVSRFTGTILATQGRGPSVHEDGPRGPLPTPGRGRIRTAGSRRDASATRSRARVISCGSDATGTPRHFTVLSSRDTR